jgi:hypothetical protein
VCGGIHWRRCIRATKELATGFEPSSLEERLGEMTGRLVPSSSYRTTRSPAVDIPQLRRKGRRERIPSVAIGFFWLLWWFSLPLIHHLLALQRLAIVWKASNPKRYPRFAGNHQCSIYLDASSVGALGGFHSGYVVAIETMRAIRFWSCSSLWASLPF